MGKSEINYSGIDKKRFACLLSRMEGEWYVMLFFYKLCSFFS